MFKEQFRNQLIIASVIIILSVAGFLFGKTEYYYFSDQFGYAEITKELYQSNRNDPEYLTRIIKKHLFNLPIGLIVTAFSLFAWTIFQYKVYNKLKKDEALHPQSFKDFAEYYYNWGFNLTIINGLMQNINSYQDSYKIPINDWEGYRNVRQTKNQIESLDWSKATGIGAITGVSDLVCIDFDGCKDYEFIKGFLTALKLPTDYRWVVRSGSHTGFHIWLKASGWPSSIPYPPNNTLYYFPLNEYRVLFKQIEFRLSDHVVLPPSKNRDGNTYSFLSETPICPPDEIVITKIIKTIERVSFCKNSYEYQVTNERQSMSVVFIYNELKNDNYEVNFCATNQYGGSATHITKFVTSSNPSQLLEQPVYYEICNALNQADLLVLFDSGDLIKETIRTLKANNLISYNKPVFQINEVIKQHYSRSFNSIIELYLCLFPFGSLHLQKNINNLDLFIKVFFKLADHYQDLRFKFKQYLNLDASFFNVQIPDTDNDRFEAAYLSQQHEFLLRFTVAPDINTSSGEYVIRTILPTEITIVSEEKYILTGFSFSDCEICHYYLDSISNMVINPQLIDYSN